MKKFDYLKNITRLAVVPLFILGLIVGMGYPGVQVAFAEDTVKAEDTKAEDAKEEEVEEVSNDYTLDEVTVTANRREEKLQDVSVSVSAMNEEKLEQMGASDLKDYMRSVPGVQFSASNPGSMNISIRGVRSVDSAPVGGAMVGYYLDEVSIPTAFDFPDINTFDMARVEVLRGPQGTLFGEGSLGGTIRSITNKPSFTGLDFSTETTYYDINEGGDGYNLKAMLNIPLGEKAAFRFAGFKEDRDGYIDNPYVGKDDINDYQTTGGRAMFRWMPNEKFDLLATINLRSSEFGGKNNADTDLQQESSILADGEDEYFMYNLTGTYKMSNFDIVSSTSYFDREAPRSTDMAGLIPTINLMAFYYNPVLPAMFGGPPDPVFTAVWTETDFDYKMFTQELRLVSTNDAAFQWTVGLFYKDYNKIEEMDAFGMPDLPLNQATIATMLGFGLIPAGSTKSMYIHSDTDVEQMALFGEVSYDFTEKWQALVGLRVFREKRESTIENDGLFVIYQGAVPSINQYDSKETVINPKFTLTYKFTDDMLSYATVAKGFRSGGLNEFAAFFPGADQTYEPEELWSYELGMKTAWLDGRVIVNGSLFYLDWDNLIAAISATPGIPLQGNIGSARTFGADITLSLLPAKGLQIDLGANWLDPKSSEEFTTMDGTYSKGTTLPGIPEFSCNAAVSYSRFIGNFLGSVRADYTYTGKSEFSFDGDTKNKDYGLLNLSTSLSIKQWEAVLFVQNVTDKRAEIGGRFDAAALPGYGLGPQSLTTQPRTIGLTLRYKF